MRTKDFALLVGIGVLTFIASSYGYADISSAGDAATQEISKWVAAGGTMGLALFAGMWIISEVTPIRIFDHLVAEQKRKIIFLIIFFGVLTYFNDEVANLYKKITNPVSIFTGK